MMFGGLLLLLGLGAGAYYLATRQLPGIQTALPHNQKTALDILQERYARGEITKAEYVEMREQISR